MGKEMDRKVLLLKSKEGKPFSDREEDVLQLEYYAKS